MTRSSLQRVLITIAVAGIIPAVAGCPKKAVPVVVDAEPPPVVIDAAPTVLEPLGEDAGADAAEAGKAHTGTWKPQDPFVARLKQCCAALSSQAKANGNPPDLMPAVNLCNATAAQLTANPNAPELNALRQS